MIKIEIVGTNQNVGLITLNRPKVLNALCRQLMDEVSRKISFLYVCYGYPKNLLNYPPPRLLTFLSFIFARLQREGVAQVLNSLNIFSLFKH